MTAPRGDWMQTFTGRQFWPIDPQPKDFRILDIAHALSNLCRFAGHTRTFYSVAQHSVLVSRVCDRADALDGLLHDASEAYLVDIPRPVKHDPALTGYRVLEARMEGAIADAFHTSHRMPASVKLADEILLATEARDLMWVSPASWHLEEEPLEKTITPWSPRKARRKFLKRFYQLTDFD